MAYPMQHYNAPSGQMFAPTPPPPPPPRNPYSQQQQHQYQQPNQYQQPQRMQQQTAQKNQFSYTCDLCSVTLNSQAMVETHLNGRKHLHRVQETNSTEKQQSFSFETQTSNFFCDLCQVTCTNQEMLNSHKIGKKHQKMEKHVELVQLKEQKDPSVYCDICNIFLGLDLMKAHKEGNKHKRKLEHPVSEDGDSKSPQAKKMKGPPVYVSAADLGLSIAHCGICNTTFPDEGFAILHYQSDKHVTKAKAVILEKSPFSCKLCSVVCSSEELFQKHKEGFKHQWKESKGTLDPEGPFAKRVANALKSRLVHKRRKGEDEEGGTVKVESEQAKLQQQ